jgi:hypothetical protein
VRRDHHGSTTRTVVKCCLSLLQLHTKWITSVVVRWRQRPDKLPSKPPFVVFAAVEGPRPASPAPSKNNTTDFCGKVAPFTRDHEFSGAVVGFYAARLTDILAGNYFWTGILPIVSAANYKRLVVDAHITQNIYKLDPHSLRTRCAPSQELNHYLLIPELYFLRKYK